MFGLTVIHLFASPEDGAQIWIRMRLLLHGRFQMPSWTRQTVLARFDSQYMQGGKFMWLCILLRALRMRNVFSFSSGWKVKTLTTQFTHKLFACAAPQGHKHVMEYDVTRLTFLCCKRTRTWGSGPIKDHLAGMLPRPRYKIDEYVT